MRLAPDRVTSMTGKLAVPEQAILEHLADVVASEAFRGSERSRALLDFIVRHTLRGDADRLKEYTIGVDVLGRGPAFDPRVDPIVRAEASRLRRRLEQYYAGEGAGATLRIVLPKGGYVPEFVTVPLHETEAPKRTDRKRLDEARSSAARMKWFVAGAAAGAAIMAAVAALVRDRAMPERPTASPRPLQLSVELRANGATLGSDVGTDVVLSPDATRAVFVARGADRRGRLYVLRLGDGVVSELPGTDGARAPFFAPDGLWVGFWADGAVKKIAVDGGAPIELARSPDLLGASWTTDGHIVAVTAFGVLSRIPSAGGAADVILDTSAESVSLGWPQVLPDGRNALIAARRIDGDAAIEIVSLPDGARRPIVAGGTFPRHVAAAGADYVLYVNQGTVYALPFDIERQAARGPAFPVLQDVAYAPNFGYAQLDVSANGVLVYQRDTGHSVLSWVDRQGTIVPLALKPGRYFGPRLSPDGERVLVRVLESGVWQLVVHDSSQERTLKLGGPDLGAALWAPDGAAVAVTAAGGLALLPIDGARDPRPVARVGAVIPWSFSPDGNRLAYHASGGATHFDLWTIPLREEGGQMASGAPEPYLRTAAVETWPAFSPDGRWLAHASSESGSFEVYVRAFPDSGAVVQVSRGGGRIPTWSRNGRELLYQTDDERIMVVEYSVVDGRFVAGAPREWAPVRLAETGVLPAFDLAPDGERVIALLPSQRPEDRSTPNHVTFIFDFFDFAKRLGPR